VAPDRFGPSSWSSSRWHGAEHGRARRRETRISPRAAGKAVYRSEADERIAAHQRIRDDLVSIFSAGGFAVRPTEGGSYLFPQLPRLGVSPAEYVERMRGEGGVVVTPGGEFGPRHGGSVRLNFSQNHARAVLAAQTMVALAARTT
jgi:aspartate/methionine/tyrosine aminotransferase